MTTLVLLAVAVIVVGFLCVAVRGARREHSLAASGDFATVPWIDGVGGGSDCNAGSAADGGCGDGGGGGGGGPD